MGPHSTGPHRPSPAGNRIALGEADGDLSVARGRTVRFVVRNLDPIDHEVIVGDQAVQDLHERGTEAHHGTVPGEVSVPAGAEAETTYTFAEAGSVILGCHLPGHWDYGMRTRIEVEG